MPANKSKGAKPAKIQGVPTRAGATTSAGDGPSDDDRRTAVPAPPQATTHPMAKKKTADGPAAGAPRPENARPTAPAKQASDGKATGAKAGKPTASTATANAAATDERAVTGRV